MRYERVPLWSIRVELDMPIEKWPLLVFAVADEEDGGESLVGNFFEQVKQGIPVSIIESLGCLIKDKEFRALDKGSGNEQQLLFGKRQSTKRGIGPVLKTCPGKPAQTGFYIRGLNLPVQPD